MHSLAMSMSFSVTSGSIRTANWRNSLFDDATRAMSSFGASTSGRNCFQSVAAFETCRVVSSCSRLGSARQRGHRCLCSKQLTYQRTKVGGAGIWCLLFSTLTEYFLQSLQQKGNSTSGGLNGHHALDVVSYEASGAIALPHGHSQRHSLESEEGSNAGAAAFSVVPDGRIITVGSSPAKIATLGQRRKAASGTHKDPVMELLVESLNVNNLRKVIRLSISAFRPLHYRCVAL